MGNDNRLWDIRTHLDRNHGIGLDWTREWSYQELKDKHKDLESKNRIDHENKEIEV